MKSPGRKQRVKKRSSPVRGRKKALGFSGQVAKPLSHDRGFRVDWQGRGKSPKAALPSGQHPREFVAGANSPRSPTAEKRVARGMSPTAGEPIPPARAINQKAIFLEPRWKAGEKKIGTMPPMGMVPTFRMGRVRACVTVARSRRGRPRPGLRPTASHRPVRARPRRLCRRPDRPWCSWRYVATGFPSGPRRSNARCSRTAPGAGPAS